MTTGDGSVEKPGRPRQSGPQAELLAVYRRRKAEGAAVTSVKPVASVLSRLRRLAWMISVTRRLPWEHIELSRSAQGDAIDRLLRHRSIRLVPTNRRVRFGYCVLEIPPTSEEYLRGHDRRRLRKRLSRVQRRDLTIQPLDDVQRAAVERSLLDDVEALRIETRPIAQLWLGAFVDSPVPVALVIVLLDGDVAMLHTSQGDLRGRDIDLRYALHTKLVEYLIDNRIRVMVTDSQNCFRTPPMLLQYQYHLGYVVRNLHWRH